MKLPINRLKNQMGHDFARRIAGGAMTLGLALALAGCGMVGGDSRPAEGSTPMSATANGPQADYPVVIGQPYSVAGTTYTPNDVLNYDEVGYLAADRAGGDAITGAHHTLPLPSYVEVTSLETGRTILVRLERRGPMDNNRLLALSPGALRQLGGDANAPVRVRRVNPPESHRAILREGEAAPLRMDTPMPLVEVLKRKLPAGGAPALSAGAGDAATVAASTPLTRVQVPPSSAVAPAPSSAASPTAPVPLPPIAASIPTPPQVEESADQSSTAPPKREVTSGLVVQVGAFSTSERAQRVANAIEGAVSRAGNLYRVRTGPFATRAQAEASLAKVRAAGYRDARIFTSG